MNTTTPEAAGTRPAWFETLLADFSKIVGQYVTHVADDNVDRSMVEAITKVGRALGIATQSKTGKVFLERIVNRLRGDVHIMHADLDIAPRDARESGRGGCGRPR